MIAEIDEAMDMASTAEHVISLEEREKLVLYGFVIGMRSGDIVRPSKISNVKNDSEEIHRFSTA